MTLPHALLAGGTVLSILLWAALSFYVLAIQRRRVATQEILRAALTTLGREDLRPLSVEARVERMEPLVTHASRELIMRAASDPETSDEAFEPLAAYLLRTSGLDQLIGDVSTHRSRREAWRRTAALRVLVRLKHGRAMEWLGQAIEEPDHDVSSAALALLGASEDPRAIDVLIDALKSHRLSAAEVATQLDHTPQWIADRLRALLSSRDPVVRSWGATLLARYPEEPVEQELAELTRDDDPRVRKAAVQTLGTVGDVLAATCALRLLHDPISYVRAHAARSLGELERSDLADDVAALLGDPDWWVRLAAKESLAMMGGDVWPVLMRSLRHTDRFVRNGAAEVFQNLGVLDSLIVMEAAADSPSEAKIAILREVAAAGGMRFTDALIERAGPIIGARISQLLSTIGLEHVGAA